MARGNTSRMASTLDGHRAGRRAAARARGHPHAAHRHRADASAAGAVQRQPGGQSGLARHQLVGRAQLAEPMLNAWASKLLGNATKIRCTIERLDDTTGAVAETRTLPLSEVAVGALDMVYGVEASTSATQPDGALSEIEQQVLYYAKHKTGGFDPQATICGCSMRGRPIWRPARRRCSTRWNRRAPCGGCCRACAAPTRRISIRPSAPATARSTSPSSRRGWCGPRTRSTRRNKALKALVAPTATTTTAEALRTALMKLGAFGVGPGGADRRGRAKARPAIATLGMQAKALLKTSGARLDQVAALRARAGGDGPAARAGASWSTACAAVFGQNVRGAAAVHLRRRRRRRARPPRWRRASRPRAAIRWRRTAGSRSMPRVRDPMAPLERVPARRRGAGHRRAAESQRRAIAVRGRRALGGTAARAGQVARAPASCRWCCRRSPPINTAQPLTGLLVDEWTEVGAEHARDHRHHVPVRSARRLRAAKRAAGGAAGAGRRIGQPTRCARCWRRRSISPSCAPWMPRRWARSRSICRRSTSPSTPRTTRCRPTSRALTH